MASDPALVPAGHVTVAVGHAEWPDVSRPVAYYVALPEVLAVRLNRDTAGQDRLLRQVADRADSWLRAQARAAGL